MTRRKFKCLDCQVDTGKIHEHYFIHTATWLSVVKSIRGMLCVGCLEKRLERRLTKADFPDITVNNPRYEAKSQRLMERMVNLHFEIWGGWNDAAYGVEAEFLETCTSYEETKKALSEYRKGNRYAYARDMDKNGETVNM